MSNWTKSHPNVWSTASPGGGSIFFLALIDLLTFGFVWLVVPLPLPWPPLLAAGLSGILAVCLLCLVRSTTLDTKRCILRSRWLVGNTDVLKFKSGMIRVRWMRGCGQMRATVQLKIGRQERTLFTTSNPISAWRLGYHIARDMHVDFIDDLFASCRVRPARSLRSAWKATETSHRNHPPKRMWSEVLEEDEEFVAICPARYSSPRAIAAAFVALLPFCLVLAAWFASKHQFRVAAPFACLALIGAASFAVHGLDRWMALLEPFRHQVLVVTPNTIIIESRLFWNLSVIEIPCEGLRQFRVSNIEVPNYSVLVAIGESAGGCFGATLSRRELRYIYGRAAALLERQRKLTDSRS